MSDSLTVLRISDHLLFWLSGCLKISQKVWEYLKIYWSDCLIIWWSEKIWRWDLMIWESEIFWYQKISDSQIIRYSDQQTPSFFQYVRSILLISAFFRWSDFLRPLELLSSCWCYWCMSLLIRLSLALWSCAHFLCYPCHVSVLIRLSSSLVMIDGIQLIVLSPALSVSPCFDSPLHSIPSDEVGKCSDRLTGSFRLVFPAFLCHQALTPPCVAYSQDLLGVWNHARSWQIS